MIVYGPIPSRRLGQSIGINNVPPKTCPYSCVYCQIGRTNKMQIKRSEFYNPEDVYQEAYNKLMQLKAENRQADYFSFVPDGEPTLDLNLGKTIDLLRPLGTKIAVITNASILWMDEVKEDLMNADWVSVSIDAADETAWRKIDRPYGTLDHRDIIQGIKDFSKYYKGTLVTETMFVNGINDSTSSVEKIAEVLADISPCKAYFLVPTRPPAEKNVQRPSSEFLRQAVGITRAVSGVEVECITGDEDENGFFVTDDIQNDLLGIASVHPIRKDIVEGILKKRNADRSILREPLERGKITEFTYEGKTFYRKNI